MNDGCTNAGQVVSTNHAPVWIYPNHAHPGHFAFYIQVRRQEFQGHFNQPVDLFERHNATLHTPLSVQIHIRHRTERSEFYMANPFEVYTFEQQNGWASRDNYVYVVVPGNNAIYRAFLRPQNYKKDDDRINSTYPGIPGPKSRSPKRRRIQHYRHVNRGDSTFLYIYK